MKISMKKLLLLIGVGLVVVLALIHFSAPGSGAPLNSELQASVDWAYLDAHRLSVELKITGENVPEFLFMRGPIYKMILQKPSGEVVSEVEYVTKYWDDENHDLYVAQTFTHDLDVSSGEVQQFVLEIVFSEGEQPTSLTFEVTPSKGLTLSPAQVVTNNNVSVELVSVEINNRTIISEICFDLPSLLEWHAAPYIEGQKGDGLGGSLLDYDDDAVETPHRCYEFTMQNSHGYEIAGKESITIRIDEIKTTLPEQFSPEEVERANQRSVLEGVSFDVIPGDHTWDIKIISKPDDMSDEEAHHVAWESLPERIEGPWVFTIPLP